MYSRTIIVIIITSYLFTLTACNSIKYKNQSFHDFIRTHTYAVGQTNHTFVDSLRNRPLVTEIWYPTKDTTKFNITTEYPFKVPPTSKDADFIPKKFPLILLSHGTGGNRINHMWLACELASNGYVVLAVDHFGNTFDNKIPENFVKVWDRPLDFKFILDNIFKSKKFNTVIDTDKIGMLGFSLGGYTTIALAGAELNYNYMREFSSTEEGKKEADIPELGDVSKLMTPEIVKKGNNEYKNLKDDRISAFVALAPALGQGFQKEEQFKNINEPVLIVGAEKDERAPVNTNAKHFHMLMKNSKYIELRGNVGHFVFINEAKDELKRKAPLIFEDDKSINRKKIHMKVSDIVQKYFDEKLKTIR